MKSRIMLTKTERLALCPSPQPPSLREGGHVSRDIGDLVANIAARLKVPPRLKGMRRDLGGKDCLSTL